MAAITIVVDLLPGATITAYERHDEGVSRCLRNRCSDNCLCRVSLGAQIAASRGGLWLALYTARHISE